MAIIIEIGTDEQKELVRQEMEPLFNAIEQLDPPLNLGDVIVTADFDAKVNELQKTTDYRSVRGVTAAAKIVESPGSDRIAIILSDRLFTDLEDTQTRYVTYMHEIFHIINRRKAFAVPSNSLAAQEYLGNLWILLDEYTADRIAFQMINRIYPERSPRLQAYLERSTEGFAALINDPQRYDRMRQEIAQFRWHHDVGRFLKGIYADFDDVSLSLLHLWALVDEYPEFAASADLGASHFVNARTLRLHDYLRNKFEQKSLDFRDGLA